MRKIIIENDDIHLGDTFSSLQDLRNFEGLARKMYTYAQVRKDSEENRNKAIDGKQIHPHRFSSVGASIFTRK